MKSFLKLLLSIFLIIAVIGIGVQISRTSDYKSISENPNINNTIKANGSTVQKHEQEGLNYFIVMAVVCGAGLFLLSIKKNTVYTDKEVIQSEVNQEELQVSNTISATIKKEGICFKIGMSVTLILIIAMVVGAAYKFHEQTKEQLYIESDSTKLTKNYNDIQFGLDDIVKDIRYDVPDINEKSVKNKKYIATKIYTSSYLNNTNNNTENNKNLCLIFYTPSKSGFSSVIVYNTLTNKYGILKSSIDLKYLAYILFNIDDFK